MNKILRSSLIAIFAGFFTAIVVLVFFSDNPLRVLYGFFLGSFSSSYYFGNWLNIATLLIFASLGIALSQKSGNLNLGGEGQIYFSGFMTGLLLSRFEQAPPIVAFVVVAFIVCCTTGCIGALCGILKVYRGSNEILTSFLFSAALIPFIDYGVIVLKDQTKNLLAMPLIASQLRLNSLLSPSQFNVSFFIALLFVGGVALFLYKTRIGYIYRMTGIAPEFAYYSGFSPRKTTIIGLFLSASFHGLSGFFAVVGTYYTCYTGFYAGLGWNALTASLIARSNPLAIFPACLLMAFFTSSANYASLTNNLAIDVTDIISAVMLICVTAQFAWAQQKKGL